MHGPYTGQPPPTRWGDRVAASPAAETPLVRKLGQFMAFSPEELACLGRMQEPNQRLPRRVDLLAEGGSGRRCFVLLEGWTCCYKMLADGRRQIVNFAVPGDFLGLGNVLLNVADHSISSITPIRVRSLSAAELTEIISRYPRIGIAVMWALSCEEAIIVEHLVNIGRRNALERVAHLLLELGTRLWVAGLAAGDDYELPLVQDEMADALGLTSIHVNRILRQLRERQLVSLTGSRLRIHDADGLARLAQLSNGYLDRNNRPAAAACG